MAQKKYPIAFWPLNEGVSDITFTWLWNMRWGAVFCQIILIILASSYLEIAVPVIFVSTILTFEVASNLLFAILYKRKKNIPEWLFGSIMLLDIILLTALLFSTGGPMNPFTFLYLVHIVLGAVLMRSYWSWTLTVFTLICYAMLFRIDQNVFGQLQLILPGGFIGTSELQQTCHDVFSEYSMLTDHMRLHLKGMLLAFAISAFFIIFFVGRIQKALEKQQQALVSLEEERARSEKLASLATLAAGAAHEFSTPLSTIAVAAGEMLHHLKKGSVNLELVEDAELIKGQVKVCKDILYQMAADAGEYLGESLEKITTGAILDQVVAEFSASEQKRITVEDLSDSLTIMVPFRTLVRTIKGLVKNGLDASPLDLPVLLRCHHDKNFMYFQVIDQGEGMSEDIMTRAAEPFFTTKEFGKGLGLGLFLAQNVAEQFGGSLTISSEKQRGSSVTISLALSQIAIE